MAIVFALMTAIAYGFDHYFIRRGLINTPYPMVAAFVTLTINFFFFVVLSLILEPLHHLRLDEIYFFVIAGILAPGLARVLSYKGLETLGMSITTPIVNSESIFAVAMAILFLHEPMSFPIVGGILSVVFGLALLGYESGYRKGAGHPERVRYRYVFYPLLASIFYGVSVFFRKLGLNSLGSPVLGAAITSGTSWVILTLSLATSGRVRQFAQMTYRNLFYFLMGGLATCVAWFSLFHALHMGRVSIISPIATSYSLVTLILSVLFLRDVERINLKIVFATFLIVGGIILLCLVK